MEDLGKTTLHWNKFAFIELKPPRRLGGRECAMPENKVGTRVGLEPTTN